MGAGGRSRPRPALGAGGRGAGGRSGLRGAARHLGPGREDRGGERSGRLSGERGPDWEGRGGQMDVFEYRRSVQLGVLEGAQVMRPELSP